jgi:hypothetical protein
MADANRSMENKKAGKERHICGRQKLLPECAETIISLPAGK